MKAREYEEKPCAVCGTPFGPRSYASQLGRLAWFDFDRQTTCGNRCSAQVASKAKNDRPYEEKPCGLCGKMRGPLKRPNGTFMWTKFDRSRFCGDCWTNKRSACNGREYNCKLCNKPVPKKHRALCDACWAIRSAQIEEQKAANALNKRDAKPFGGVATVEIAGQLFTVDEIAQTLGVSRETVKQRVQGLKRLGLPHHQVLNVTKGRGNRLGVVRTGQYGRLITHDGVTLSISGWARRLGISTVAMSKRFKFFSEEEAITRPVQPKNPLNQGMDSKKYKHGDLELSAREWSVRLGISENGMRHRFSTMSVAAAVETPVSTEQQARGAGRMLKAPKAPE